MRKFSSFLLVLIFLYCCQSADQEEKNTLTAVNKSMNEKAKEAISPALYAEMKSLSDQLDTLTSDSMGIIAVVILKKNYECLLIMGTQPFVDHQRLDGAYLLRERLFAFYIEDSICNIGIIYPDKLKNINLQKYRNNQSFKPLGPYEPWGRKYKILGPDSLELVYSGYL